MIRGDIVGHRQRGGPSSARVLTCSDLHISNTATLHDILIMQYPLKHL